MRQSLKNLDYLTVIKYLFITFIFTVFAKLEKQTLPYSCSVYISAISTSFSIIPTTLLYLGSFLILGSPGLLGANAILCAVSIVIVLIHRKYFRKAHLELTACALIGMLGFVFLGDTSTPITLEKRILTAIISVLLSFLCLIVSKAISEKGLKFKFSFEEYASLILLVSILGTGACNLLTPYFWRAVCVLIILIVCYLYRTGIATLTSAVLGISFALYYKDITFVAVFLCLGLSAESLMPLSRYASAISVIMADYLMQLLFGVYGGYTLIDLISLLFGVVIFCIIPTKPLKALKERLYSFRERQLVRQTINRNRAILSGKLYDLANVFQEMSVAFSVFEKQTLTEDKAKIAMQRQILNEICGECEYKTRCKKSEKDISFGLDKIIDIGFAKGKLSLIDMPKELSENCFRPNNILYALNKLLSDFRAYALEKNNHKIGRELIASQAQGVSEILSTLAFETGTQLKYHSRLERALADKLFKSGFYISEILIYGDEDRRAVSMIITMQEFSIQRLQMLIKEVLGFDTVLTEHTKITENKTYLLFNHTISFDAVYGISRATKDGSLACGDTHSVTRISGDRLLVALSDGMGSGKNAQNVSSTALSLIESFYKAGLSSPLILSTVNKLLSINTEDTFTALDMSVINLKNPSADFIKYGAPYGFILGDEGVKIVEGNSLPLGILDELKPSVCTAQLNDGDIILLVTDGISDAFSSSGEIIDFLREQTAKNPQTLTDDLLAKAINLNAGAKKDDMTALAVRIFKRKPA